MTHTTLRSLVNQVIQPWYMPRLQSGDVIFCDFDGPIVDVSARYYATYEQSLKTLAGTLPALAAAWTPLSPCEFWAMKCDRVPDADIAAASGLAPAQLPQFMAIVQQVVNSPDLIELDRLQVGVVAALSRLRQHGVSVMIVSLRQTEQIEQMVRRWGLRPFIHHVIGAESETAAYLNHADHKTALLKQAIALAQSQGLQPGWMIGDTEADILAAQALRLPVAAVTTGIRSAPYLKQFQPTLLTHDLHLVTRSLLTDTSAARSLWSPPWQNWRYPQPELC